MAKCIKRGVFKKSRREDVHVGDSRVCILGRDAMCIVGRCPEALWLFLPPDTIGFSSIKLEARAGSLFLAPG